MRIEYPVNTSSEEASDTVNGDLKKATEGILVIAARSGKDAAFEELFKRYSARIYRTARGLTQNREEAEDVVQESFLKAFKNLSRFRGDSLLSTWLTRIAVNEALMGLRRRKPVSLERDVRSDSFTAPWEIRSCDLSPEEQCARGELSVAIARALDQLKPGLRVIFQLREIDRISTEETAQILGLSMSAVKSRLLRARLQLRQSLSPYLRHRPVQQGGRADRFTNTVSLGESLRIDPRIEHADSSLLKSERGIPTTTRGVDIA